MYYYPKNKIASWLNFLSAILCWVTVDAIVYQFEISIILVTGFDHIIPWTMNKAQATSYGFDTSAVEVLSLILDMAFIIMLIRGLILRKAAKTGELSLKLHRVTIVLKSFCIVMNAMMLMVFLSIRREIFVVHNLVLASTVALFITIVVDCIAIRELPYTKN